MRLHPLRFTLVLLALLTVPATTALSAESTQSYTEPTTSMQFVYIPGAAPVYEESSGQEATVVREEILPFLIGRTEVTFDQYIKFCASTGRLIPNDRGWGFDNRPVINVSWYDAVAFTKWLSEQAGKNFRLPTLTEWEHAARGGTTADFPWDTSAPPPHANCRNCGSEWDGRMTAPVGSFQPNGYGLYDVIGNVFEWTSDGAEFETTGDGVLKNSLSDEPAMRRQGSSSYLEPLLGWDRLRQYSDRPDAVEPEYGFRVLLEVDSPVPAGN